MYNIKVWPHLTVIAIGIAVLSGLGVALWMRHEQRVAAEALPPAARIQQVNGEVALQNGPYEQDEWIRAEPNQPFSVGDRIYTQSNSRASLAFTGRNFAMLEPDTSLDALMFSDHRTQLALRDGSALFDVGYLDSGELFEVGTPYGAVNFHEPGLYRVDLDDSGALISVLSGLAQVVGLAGSGQISSGEVLRLVGQTAADIVLSRLDPDAAGYLLDDYYGYQYPNYYDGRYRDYNTYLQDPYFFDPYRRNVSYQYASSVIPGIHELDYYGDWQNLGGYGYVWQPRVESGWAPYQQGYWLNHYPYGPTWVSTEPWGYAPYHYGRWAYQGNQWFWIPEPVNSNPIYSPALVAFLPLDAQEAIGWLPLGPDDPYSVRYYDADWQPHYIRHADLNERRLANWGVPGAATIVALDQFGRVIDRRNIDRFQSHSFDHVNPVLEPLLATPLRNAVLNSAWGRGKIGIPPGIARKLGDTRVVFSEEPVVPPFRRELRQRLGVESLPARARRQQFRVRDEREGHEARGPARMRRSEGDREQRPFERGRGVPNRIQRGQENRPEQRVRGREERGRGASGERVGSPARQRPQVERPSRGRPEEGQVRGQGRPNNHAQAPVNRIEAIRNVERTRGRANASERRPNNASRPSYAGRPNSTEARPNTPSRNPGRGAERSTGGDRRANQAERRGGPPASEGSRGRGGRGRP